MREREREMVVVTCKMKDDVNREIGGCFVVPEVGHAWVLDNTRTVRHIGELSLGIHLPCVNTFFNLLLPSILLLFYLRKYHLFFLRSCQAFLSNMVACYLK